MPSLPGQTDEVFFGNTEKPLPNWRKEPAQTPDEAEPTPSEKASVAGILGFQPDEQEGE